MKKAFITGITGQDGYYLAKFLLEKIIKYLEQLEEHLLLTPQELIVLLQSMDPMKC